MSKKLVSVTEKNFYDRKSSITEKIPATDNKFCQRKKFPSQKHVSFPETGFSDRKKFPSQKKVLSQKISFFNKNKFLSHKQKYEQSTRAWLVTTCNVFKKTYLIGTYYIKTQ